MAEPRVLLAKPGLDGHDRGVKVVAMALRDAGAEVVYLGLRATPAAIARAAAEEDVAVIGLSILSGAHVPLTEQVVACRDGLGIAGIPIVVVETVPADDVDRLLSAGATQVFPVGTPLPVVVDGVLALAGPASATPRGAA